jgi:hypothetical protein
MKMKQICILLYLSVLQYARLPAQNVFVLDSKLNIDCVNCENPNNAPLFQIFVLNRFTENSDIPDFATLYYGDTKIDPFYIDISDTIELNCEKYYSYGPLFYSCESFGTSYPFNIDFGKDCKFFHDSSSFELKFEINALRFPTLFNSSNIQLSNLPTRINKNSDSVTLSIIEKNPSKFYTEFELITSNKDSSGILLKDKYSTNITILPSNLTYGFHSYKIKAMGQLEFDGGVVHESESIHSFSVDSLPKPINWFNFLEGPFYNSLNNCIRLPKDRDSVILPFKLKLNDYDLSKLEFQFNSHGETIKPLKFEINSDNHDTTNGFVILKEIFPINRVKQNLSLKILEKQSCALLYANSWELIFDSLVNSSNEISPPSEFKIFPNPFFNTLVIDNAKDGEIELFNSYGNLIFKNRVQNGLNRFDLPDLPDGFYLVKITSQEASEVHRMLRIH